MKKQSPIFVSDKKPSEKKVHKKIRPGAKALIVHKNKILVISERTSHGEIIHDFPGGGIEYGETVTDALIREVKEEIGLDVKPIKPVGSWSFLLDWWNVHIVCIGYQCELTGPLELNFNNNPAEEDIFEVKWYTKEELIEGKILRSPEMKAAVALVEI